MLRETSVVEVCFAFGHLDPLQNVPNVIRKVKFREITYLRVSNMQSQEK
jgi:hypothetical protein